MPPTAPTLPTGTAASATGMSMAWTPSRDNVGVAGYDVYLNGSPTKSSSTSFTVDGLSCATSYTVAVDAYDAAGNVSPTATSAMSTSSCPTLTTNPWKQVFYDDFQTFDSTK